jgi:hypothetical protein
VRCDVRRNIASGTCSVTWHTPADSLVAPSKLARRNGGIPTCRDPQQSGCQ